MKKSFILILLFLSSLCFSPAICRAQTDLDSSSYKLKQSNYFIARYVIGSGGVLNASGANYLHSATAGQPCAEVSQGANNWLFAGFWLPEGYGPTGVNQEEAIDPPKAFELYQNYPNPCNPQTTIRYDLPEECLVNVEIFNVVGQLIRLVSSQIQGPGRAHVFWNARDEGGKMMGSGVYLYRVTAFRTTAGKNEGNILFQQTKKILLVK